MSEPKKIIEQLTCKLCGHEWFPRYFGTTPRICPKCKSRFWNIGRRRAVRKPKEEEEGA